MAKEVGSCLCLEPSLPLLSSPLLSALLESWRQPTALGANGGALQDFSFYDLDDERLVRPSDLLIGDARGHRYKSIETEMSASQRSVLQTMIASKEIQGQMEARKQQLGDLEKKTAADLAVTQAAVERKFGQLKLLVDALEKASLEQLTECYQRSVPAVQDSLKRLDELMLGVQHSHQARAIPVPASL